MEGENGLDIFCKACSSIAAVERAQGHMPDSEQQEVRLPLSTVSLDKDDYPRKPVHTVAFKHLLFPLCVSSCRHDVTVMLLTFPSHGRCIQSLMACTWHFTVVTTAPLERFVRHRALWVWNCPRPKACCSRRAAPRASYSAMSPLCYYAAFATAFGIQSCERGDAEALVPGTCPEWSVICRKLWAWRLQAVRCLLHQKQSPSPLLLS